MREGYPRRNYRRCHEQFSAADFASLLVELWDNRDLSIGSLVHRFASEIPTEIFDQLGEEQWRRGNIYSVVNRLIDQISADNSAQATAQLVHLSEVDDLQSYRTDVLHAGDAAKSSPG